MAGLGRGQERHDRIGDDRGGSAGQVMTGALDKLEVSIRQGPSQAAGGLEGNHGVLGVGEHQNRRLYRRDGALQLVELAQGARLAADSATPPPKECPTSTARAIPCESRSSRTARAFTANPPAGSRLEP